MGSGELDVMAVSLAVARRLVTREQARSAVMTAAPGTPAARSLGLPDGLRREAADPDRLPEAERRECLEIFRDLFPLAADTADQPTLIESGAPGDFSAPAPAPGSRLGRYLLQEELGRGGMGVVYKARDGESGQVVAVKCMLRADDPTEVARFNREARTSLQLSHPNVVRVLEVGVHEGFPYIAMEFVQGRPMSDLLSPHRSKGRPLSVDQSLGLIRDAALALGHAHERNIVHRDVKPQNIMVSEAGEVKVMDFGLAREARRGMTVTSTGDVIGTPQYMSPEQARGEREKIGPRTDVWALGVMLYEVAARSSPFDGETAAEVLHKVTHDDPVRPRKRNPAIAKDLETVILKCLEQDPRDRYASGTKLAEDLGRHLDGVPVLARPPGLVRRVKRTIVRRRGIVIAAAVGVAAVAFVTAVLLPRLGTAEREAAEAETGRSQAELSMKLWGSISNFITEAEVNARMGDTKIAHDKLDQGIAVCRDFLKTQELAHARYFLGRLLRARGRRVEALVELDRALAASPGMGEARLERGLALFEQYADRVRPLFRQMLAEFRMEGRKPLPPDEFVKLLPADVRALRDRIIADLSVEAGLSSYFKKTDALFGKAELLRATGQDTRARLQIEEILKIDPRHERALLEMAYLCDGDPATAADWASRAIDAHRGYADAYLARSHEYFQRAERDPGSEKAGEWRRQCQEDAEKAIALGGETAEALGCRAIARYRRGEKKESLADFDRALELDPQSSPVVSNRGFARIGTGDLEGALADLNEAIRLNPASATAWANRGVVKSKKRDLEGALADYETALRMNPSFLEARVSRGVIRHTQGRYDEALADYDAVLRANPRHAGALGKRALTRRAQGDLDGALSDSEAALKADPGRVDCWSARGHVRFSRGDRDGAMADAEQVIQLDPAFYDGWSLRGQVRLAKGDYAGAVADLDRAISIDPRKVDSYDARGQARTRLKDLDGALADFDKAVELAPDSAQEYNGRGTVRLFQGDVVGAIADYDRSIALKADHALSWHNRGIAKRHKKDLDGAIADQSQALKLDPKQGGAWYERGLVRSDKNDLAGALSDLAEAIRLDPKNPEILAFRGLVRRDAGDIAGAIEDVSAALQAAPAGWLRRAEMQRELEALKKDLKK